MRKRTPPFSRLFAAVACLPLPAAAHVAATPGPHFATQTTADTTRPPRHRPRRTETAPVSDPAFAALLAHARAMGSVPVIVGLRVAFRPEGELPDAKAVRAQRRAIATAQRRVLRRLAACHITNVKQFTYSPFIALTADAAALLQLKAAPEVKSIEADAPLAPAQG